MIRLRLSGFAPLALAIAFALLPPPAIVRAQPPGEVTRPSADQLAAQQRAFVSLKRDLVWRGARRHFAQAKERMQQAQLARRGKARRGVRVQRPVEEAPWRATGAPEAARTASPFSALAAPTNVRVNNPAGDAVGAGQSEESIAVLGDYLMAAWNDGQGFVSGGSAQGVAISIDGGASWTDLGSPPAPASHPGWIWSSDPVVVVDESNGRFYYCGLADIGLSDNAIGVAYGHFSGATFVWDAAVAVRTAPYNSTFLDKQWIAVDPATHAVYVTNTTFTTSNQIDFYRSTNGGAAWSAATKLSSATDNGYVQGSRVLVGPGGEVHVTWNAIDQVTAADNYRYRRSTDGGVSFGGEITATKHLTNFGTGAPGFNRERSIDFAGMAVDRTAGAHRGRVYLTWAESFNHQDENFTPAAAYSEVESNGFASRANAITLPVTLRGTLGNSTDQDWYALPLAAGGAVAVWADSLASDIGYTLRVFAPAPDSLQSMCFAGDLSTASPGSQSLILFEAPVAGTWYVRVAAVSGVLANRPYRLRVVAANRNAALERGRDQRDVFVSWTDDGTTWAAPVRVNDDAEGYDEFLPEIAVGPDGFPYVFWYDFRDDAPYGSRANAHVSRSTDGGATWAANQRLTTATTNFSTARTNVAPNMGDYQGIAASTTRVHFAWADGRGTDIDTWTAALRTDHVLSFCQPDTSVTANTTATLGWLVDNANAMYDDAYLVAVTTDRGWPGVTTSFPASIGALSNALLQASVPVPDTAANGIVRVCAIVRSASGALERQCCASLTVSGGIEPPPPPPTFALEQSAPNPARGTASIGFSLPRAGHVSLVIYDVRGSRVRTLADRDFTAGRHVLAWDGRDDDGHAVNAGAYYYRLEGLGQVAKKQMRFVP